MSLSDWVKAQWLTAHQSSRSLGWGLACFAMTCGLAAAQAQTDLGEHFTNSLGMVFVRVSPGRFNMGVGTDLKLVDSTNAPYDMQPAHGVSLSKSFYILQSKVRQENFAKSGVAGEAADVTWNAASQFCEWLSRREGRHYRLPTEAEWEYVWKNPQDVSDFSAREWVQDWHGIYQPLTPSISASQGQKTNTSGNDVFGDPVGPPTGICKVIRDGQQRLALPPTARSSPWELGTTAFRIVLENEPATNGFVSPAPFNQSGVKQTPAVASQGPNAQQPYFTVRFALPIPPENDTGLNGSLTGLDQSVMAHNHSPGFEILPNGDALAIYFSAKTSQGASESDPGTRFVQARLRFGAEHWDPPELFYDFKGFNEQSALLWHDGETIRFFGGGRGTSPLLPFKMVVSTNNGATWTMTLPLLDAPAKDYTAQPIVNGFRGENRAIYFAMDAGKDQSFLWRSLDEGIHWHDMGGRTGGRHSTIIPLDSQGNLLSIGGKNAGINGWSPQNRSSDWGATWSSSEPSPFPALGGNQRPSLIRLANGHLFFVSDSYWRNTGKSPGNWPHGQGVIVAISKNSGTNWHIKRLPVELPHENDRKSGTAGYATARQAPNGVIHVLTTMTHPCLHYEFNEAWVFSDAGAVPPETGSGKVQTYRESYSDGGLRASWSARICPNGRYLLDGVETTYYPNGRKEYEVTYDSGRKIQTETFWASDGSKIWSWNHGSNTSTWTHYWHNGGKRVESNWLTKTKSSDLEQREFFGLVATGPAEHWKADGTPAQTYRFSNGRRNDE